MLMMVVICAVSLFASLPATTRSHISARDALSESVDQRIAGKIPTKASALLSDYPSSWSHGVFKRNPDFWGCDIDFSCVSVWNSARGNLRAGTAISPWHVIFAAHFPLAKGERITFLSNDDQVLSRGIAATKRIGKTDLMIASLDAALPTSIVPAKLLPSGYQKFIHQGGGLPIVSFNQRKEAIVANLMGMSDIPGRHRAFSIQPSKQSDRMSFNKELIAGDSGGPTFLILNKQPILIYIIQAGRAGSGDSPHMVRRELEATMHELHANVMPAYIDFSSYSPLADSL